jgi:hypothetical protein
MKRLKFLPFLTLMLLAAPVMAEDFVYAPKDCEFRVTYPEQPSTASACNPDNAKQCHQVSTFTKIYAMDTSIRITTTCNAAEPGMLEKYSGDVMKFTLETMAKENVDDYQTGFNDHAIAKQAVLLGNKKMPDGTERLYMAQIGIGKTSVFTIEGEVMAGPETNDTDIVFGNIFKSIRPEAWDNEKKAAEGKDAPAPVDKDDEKSKD